MFELTPFRRRNRDLFEHMLESFNEVFEKTGISPLNGKSNSFCTDIVENEDAYYVEAELPGFAKGDITIDVTDNYLTIRAKRSHLEEQKDKHDKVLRQERHYGEFVREFYVDNMKEDEITANLENGILKMTIPKEQPSMPKRKQIEIH